MSPEKFASMNQCSGLIGQVCLDAPAERLGRDRHHVLPGRVAGGVAAEQEDDVVVDHRLDRDQLAVARRRLGRRLQVVDGARHPVDEQPGIDHAGEVEAGAAQHALVQQRRR